jgi:uncharacterized protein (UPF0332 family)
VSPKISKELCKHRLEQAKENIEEAELLYNANKFKGANNRAYYSIFHSIKAVLALEPIDFKKHKDVIGYFNKNYVSTNIFPRKIGRKIANASTIREDSDYDDEYIVKQEDTLEQIETAKELMKLVEEYIEE